MHYRLYELTSRGNVANGQDIEAAGDEEAAARAHELLGACGKSYELWRGTVRVLEHKGGPR